MSTADAPDPDEAVPPVLDVGGEATTAEGTVGDAPRNRVFRPSPLIVLAAFAFAFCATPFAFAAPLCWLIYLVPLAMIVWTVRTRTTVDPEAVTVRRIVGGRRVPWEQISSLRLGRRSAITAMLTDGKEVVLPAVHLRHLPALAAVSGGRLPDPTPG